MDADRGQPQDGEFHAIRIRSRKKRVAPPPPLRVKSGRVIHAARVTHVDGYRIVGRKSLPGESAA